MRKEGLPNLILKAYNEGKKNKEKTGNNLLNRFVWLGGRTRTMKEGKWVIVTSKNYDCEKQSYTSPILKAFGIKRIHSLNDICLKMIDA